MAVQILNDMPDAAVHRGDTDQQQPREPNVPRLLSRFPAARCSWLQRSPFTSCAAATFIGMRQSNRTWRKNPNPSSRR